MKKSTGSKKLRLNGLFLLWSIVIILLLSVAIGIAGVISYQRGMYDRYYQYADTMIRLNQNKFDGDDIQKCIDSGVMSDKLKTGLEDMNAIKENSDVAYMYMLYFPEKNNKDHMKYVLYANTKDDRKAGIADSTINADCGDEYTSAIYEAFYEAQFSNSDDTKSGYLLNRYQGVGDAELVMTAYRPVFDSTGRRVAVIGTDIYLRTITAHVYDYIKSIALFGILLLLIGQIGFVTIVRKNIINPVVALAGSVQNFIDLSQDCAPEDLVFESVEVKRDTEIRDLSCELTQMTESLREYMIRLRNVTVEKERIGAELSVATQIQADMLPSIFPAFPGRKEIDIYASMTPAKEVGGDFYDYYFIDPDHLAVVMADVSGKGVPAALFMVIAKTLLKNRAQQGGTPSEILYDVNNQLNENNESGLFVTVWLAILDVKTGRAMAANAGHEYPAVCRADGDYELMKRKHSPALGVLEDVDFSEYTFELNPGDRFFVYTDGVPEAVNEEKEFFGAKRMVEALNAGKEGDEAALLAAVKEKIDAFAGAAMQFDDITMLGLRYNGNKDIIRK